MEYCTIGHSAMFFYDSCSLTEYSKVVFIIILSLTIMGCLASTI